MSTDDAKIVIEKLGGAVVKINGFLIWYDLPSGKGHSLNCEYCNESDIVVAVENSKKHDGTMAGIKAKVDEQNK